jgi:hypothetical protein
MSFGDLLLDWLSIPTAVYLDLDVVRALRIGYVSERKDFFRAAAIKNGANDVREWLDQL